MWGARAPYAAICFLQRRVSAKNKYAATPRAGFPRNAPGYCKKFNPLAALTAAILFYDIFIHMDYDNHLNCDLILSWIFS